MWQHSMQTGNARHDPWARPATARFALTLKRHTGLLVVMRTQTFRVEGTLEQCEAAYRDAQMHNLLAGWWGLLSFLFMNWVALFANMSAIAEVRRLAATMQGRAQSGWR